MYLRHMYLHSFNFILEQQPEPYAHFLPVMEIIRFCDSTWWLQLHGFIFSFH